MIATTGFETPVPAYGQAPPFSQAAEEMERLMTAYAARPQSINPETLPPALREPILKALGERGDAEQIGLLPRGSFSMLRKGSLRRDAREEKARRDFIYRLIMEMSEDYLRLYRQVAAMVAITEKEIDAFVDVIDRGIKILEKDAKSTFTKVAEPEGVRTLTAYKQEAEEFRDTTLKEFRDKMESDELPKTEELESMRDEIQTRNSRFARFAKGAVSSVGRVLKTAGEATAQGFTFAAESFRKMRAADPLMAYFSAQSLRPDEPHSQSRGPDHGPGADGEKEDESESERMKPQAE